MEPVVLQNDVIRLEPLTTEHAEGLVAASAEDPSLYRYTTVPQGSEATHRYIELALEGQHQGDMVPFAIVRREDNQVVGATRFLHIERWPWPPGHRQELRATPDVAEVGSTWLAASALRTAVNTSAKLLLLTFAFEQWGVHRISLCTDARNDRSRQAMERLGVSFEGIRRADRVGTDGSIRNTACYSAISMEWPAMKHNLETRLTRLAR